MKTTTTNSRNLGLKLDHRTYELRGLPVTDDTLESAGVMAAVVVAPDAGTIEAVRLWDAPCDFLLV